MNPHDVILSIISAPSIDIWYPGLCEKLDEYTCADNTYLTTKIISDNIIKNTKYHLLPLEGEIKLEYIPDILSIFFSSRDISQLNLPDYFSKNNVFSILNSYKLIKYTPSLYDSIASLTKSIHLVQAPKNKDVSFTSPDIPHSIFISLPEENESHRLLRIAESIIHESMHLQLTLIEKKIPLIRDQSYMEYSPWTNCIRPIYGLLHALYVFSVIKLWYSSLIESEYGAYAKQRIFHIKQQVQSLNLKNCHNALTKEGQLVLDKIIKTVEI